MTVIMQDSADDDRFMKGEFDLSELEYGSDYEIIDKNRDPSKAEIDACSPHIDELITETSPNGIVFLGQVAAKYKSRMKQRIPTLQLMHPAFIARMELKVLTIKKQARKLEKFLEKLAGI